MELQPFDYQSLEALVLQKTGLKVDRGRYSEIARTLNAILDETGFPSFQSLRLALSDCAPTDPLWRQLIDRITIGETYFFRDSAQCRVLQTAVLPELIARRRAAGFRHLSLWSAGCATGEEPYTLAIMLQELIPDIAEWTISLLGTDINLVSLETARKGLYKARSFRQETRSDIEERWFTAREKNLELDPVVRDMVHFAPLNLVSEDYPSFETRTQNLDLIICRNVTIYFDEQTTRQIVQRFHSALNDGGWLVVGHSEPNALVYQGFTARNFPNAVVYQKQPPVVMNHAAPEVIDYSPPPPVLPVSSPTPPADALHEAWAASGREDWAAVERWLLFAERKTPMNPRVHYLRGLMLMNTANLDGALQSLRRAVYCDSTFVLAHYALGELYEKRGNVAEARRCWLRSQRGVADYPLHDELTEDLTVDMFLDLLQYRLSRLPEGS